MLGHRVFALEFRHRYGREETIVYLEHGTVEHAETGRKAAGCHT